MRKRSASSQKLIAEIQASEDRTKTKRVAIIKHGLVQARFLDGELSDLEAIVFRAFGRTKLKR